MIERVVSKIAPAELWDRAHVIGFANNIGAALAAQAQYPKLRVAQLLRFPFWAYSRCPAKSYAVFIGWLDDVPGSEAMFRTCISPARLKKLKQYFEGLGFRVYAGVINRTDGLKYFHNAGINDIFTDEVEVAVTFFK